MKIAITSGGPTLDDRVEARFGRCPYFVLVDPDTLQFEAIPNPNITLGGGAGTQSARLMADKGVTVVLTGNCGPNAFQTFGAAGIPVITGVSGIVREAVERFKNGQLVESSAVNFGKRSGMGAGMGRGTGMGRGLGMGRGMGMRRLQTGPGEPLQPAGGGTGSKNKAGVVSSTPQDNLDVLEQTAMSLRRQLEEIEARIDAVTKKA